MRSLLYILTSMVVIGLAFWAYHENYKTQEAQSRAEALQSEISQSRQRLRMLNAEWAYLNRPDRLRDLAEINFDSLGLLPFQPHQFGRIKEVPQPQPDPIPGFEDLTITDPIDVSSFEQFP